MVVSGINSSVVELDSIHDSDAFKYTKQTWTYGADTILYTSYMNVVIQMTPRKTRKQTILFL